MSRCDQELCENWSGDGLVCPCALFGIGKFADDTDFMERIPSRQPVTATEQETG